MSAVATSSGIATPLKRRRTSSSDDEENIKRMKKPIYYYILAPESSERDTSDSESIYSIQGHSTDLAKDTSDTSTDDPNIEFEVVSASDGEAYPFLTDASSSPEDVMKQFELADVIQLSDSTNSIWEKSSITSDSERDSRRLHLFSYCVLCRNRNPSPYYQYCFQCYKVRKNLFPPRPKRRKNMKKPLQQQDSGISLSENITGTAGERLSDQEDSSEKTEMCGICLVRPKNGIYVHYNTGHRYSCYHCSKRIYKKSGRCPVCNTHVMRVIKMY